MLFCAILSTCSFQALLRYRPNFLYPAFHVPHVLLNYVSDLSVYIRLDIRLSILISAVLKIYFVFLLTAPVSIANVFIGRIQVL